MEGLVANLAVRTLDRLSEHLQRLVLWCGGEGVVIHIGSHLPALDDLQDAVFDVLFFSFCIAGDHEVHVGRHRPALGAVGLINDDGEIEISQGASDGVQNELELVDGGDDNLLPSLQGFPQRCGVFRPSDNIGEALEGCNVVADLLVQIDAVRDYDDGVHDILVILHQRDELVCQPGDGIALTGAGTMLNQEALTNGICTGLKEEFPNAIQLVITRPDDLFDRLRLALFLFLDNLRVVLEDVSKRVFLQDFLPEIFSEDLGLFPRVAGTTVHTLVEREEPTVLPFQLRTHPNLIVINGKVDSAAARSEEWICGRPVFLVLLDGVLVGLASIAVLELHRDDRETVEEDTDIQGVHGLLSRVMKLACDAEDVLLVEVQG